MQLMQGSVMVFGIRRDFLQANSEDVWRLAFGVWRSAFGVRYDSLHSRIELECHDQMLGPPMTIEAVPNGGR
jgi:hypothetical protein